MLFPACQGQTDPQSPVELGDSRAFGMDRMTGSAHTNLAVRSPGGSSGSSLGSWIAWDWLWGKFRMLGVPFTYSGSYWELKVSIRCD